MDPSSLRLTKLGTNRLTRDQSLILLVLKSYRAPERSILFSLVRATLNSLLFLLVGWFPTGPPPYLMLLPVVGPLGFLRGDLVLIYQSS